MRSVIHNMYEDIRDVMRVFAEFESMSKVQQLLRAPEFEKRLAKAEKAIARAESYINVSFVHPCSTKNRFSLSSTGLVSGTELHCRETLLVREPRLV